MMLNFETGTFDDLPPTTTRTVQDLAALWATLPDPSDNRVVYRTYGPTGHDREAPELLYATTVLEPGDVNGEPFMTRGHTHIKPERGEWMLVLQGQGVLILQDADGRAWTEPLEPGRTLLIEGSLAHRVANLGETPLIFVVTWLADCGHNYDTQFQLRLRLEVPLE